MPVRDKAVDKALRIPGRQAHLAFDNLHWMAQVALARARGLRRFREMHDRYYYQALEELTAGRKRSHWIWYIFPQGKGLGVSRNSQIFALSRREAKRYYRDPFLWTNTLFCAQWVHYHLGRGRSLAEIMGSEIDALKFRSFVQLFNEVVPNDPMIRALAIRLSI